MKNTLLSGLAGLLFGVGLLVAGMTRPDKVVAFLDVSGDWDPSLAFVGGLLAAGVGAVLFAPSAFASDLVRPPLVLALAGVLVGYGTRLGNGCTAATACAASPGSPRAPSRAS